MKKETIIEIDASGEFPSCAGKLCFKWEYEVRHIHHDSFHVDISWNGGSTTKEGDLSETPQQGFMAALLAQLRAWMEAGVTATYVNGQSDCEGDCTCGGFGAFGEWYEGSATHTHTQQGELTVGIDTFRINARMTATVEYRKRTAIGSCHPSTSTSTADAAIGTLDADPSDIVAT